MNDVTTPQNVETAIAHAETIAQRCPGLGNHRETVLRLLAEAFAKATRAKGEQREQQRRAA